MTFAITPLRQSDRFRWGELWSEYQRFYGVDLSAEVTAGTWERLHSGRVKGFAARDPADHVLGIVHYLFHEDTWSSAPACYLQDLYVDPKARAQGCARQLIEAVAESAKTQGASTPYWLTHERNSVARQLYDRLAKNQGFIQYVYSG